MVATVEGGQRQVDELIAELPAHAWRRVSAGAGAHGPRDYDWARMLAAGATQDQRPEQDRLLPLLRTSSHASASSGLDRGSTVADRGMLPASQERSRPRSLPGPCLAGLVCPHHPRDARPRLARHHPSCCRKRGTDASEPGMIDLTLPEIRRLLTRLVLRILDTTEHVWAWSRWRRRRQHQARLSHYK